MRRGSGWALLASCAGAIYFVAVWVQQARETTAGIGYDLYRHFYPNMQYLVASLRDDPTALLWNPYQANGKAWLAVVSNGALNPLNAFFFVVDPDTALLLMTGVELVVAGVGMFLLCRQLGAGPFGAACGALAFELGNMTAWLTTWSPMCGGAYVWAPAVLLCCERILRRPSTGGAIALGIVGTLALLPGHPQVLFHVYQLVGLRILWELLGRRMQRPALTLVCLAAGLALPGFLAAVQLLPAFEVVGLGVRHTELSRAQVGTGLTWAGLRSAMTFRLEVKNPVQLAPIALATASLLRPATRFVASFYLVAGVLSLVLALGSATPLFDVYLALPLTHAFRVPERFLWLTGFCLAVLAGLGADALVARARDARSRPVGGIALALVVLGLFALHAVAAQRVMPAEWAIAALLAAAPLLRGPRAVPWVAGMLGVGLGVGLLFSPLGRPPVFPRGLVYAGLLADGETLLGDTTMLRAVRDRLTPQERAYVVDERGVFGTMPKAASMLRLPTIDDYEPQPTQRHAAIMSMMRTGRAATGVNAVYFASQQRLGNEFRRRILDLQAARFVVAYAPSDRLPDVVTPPLRLVESAGDLRLYENPQALPRAYWVPRVEIVPDRAQLAWIADGDADMRRVAVLDAAPPDGFVGAPDAGGEAQVVFETDDPTRLVLRVDAPARGFLVVSDSYYPGWRATVDERATPILRANYGFRAVEVPEGTSVVEMRFRPRSMMLGAAVSGATMLAIAVVLLASHRRRPTRADHRTRRDPL